MRREVEKKEKRKGRERATRGKKEERVPKKVPPTARKS
jgi:hypothetical protein